jgi:hypothetical protein
MFNYRRMRQGRRNLFRRSGSLSMTLLDEVVVVADQEEHEADVWEEAEEVGTEGPAASRPSLMTRMTSRH